MKKLTYTVLLGLFTSASLMADPQATQPSALPVAEKTNSINLAENTETKEQESADTMIDKSSMPADEPVSGESMNKDEQTSMQQGMSGNDTDANKAAMAEQSGFSRGSVVRSAFTSSIEDREPVDAVDKVEGSDETIYFFTELRDMSGQTARHRWEYNGEVMAEVEFNVNGPRWRVWSSKNFQPAWAGEWKVSVLNGANEVISEKTLVVEPPMAKQQEKPDASTKTIESDTEMRPAN